MNSSENQTTDESYLPFGNFEVLFAAITIILMFVFGTIANAITIITVLYSQKLKSPFYYLMMSLSVSDLMSALISILALYRLTWGYDVWMWSDFLCKTFWAFDIWTSFVTSIHILLFAFLRFVSVQWPQLFKRVSLSTTKICIAIVWLATLFVSLVPTYLWFGAVERDRLNISFTSQWPSCSLLVQNIRIANLYSIIVYPILLHIPIVLVIIFSIGLICKIMMLRKNRNRLYGMTPTESVNDSGSTRRRKESQIIVQVTLIVGSFLLGYIPRSVYLFFSLNPPPVVDGRFVFNWWFTFMEYFLVRVSECLNPVFYNLSSKKMRKETKYTLQGIWRKVTGIDELERSITHQRSRTRPNSFL